MQKEDISLFIAVLRPVLILMVCLVHAPYISSYPSGMVNVEDINTLLGPFLKDTFVRGAVPLLSVISGYLAYASFSGRRFQQFVVKKIWRLLVPYIVWNTLFAILFYIGYLFFKYPNVGALLHSGNIGDVVKVILGINRIPINAPTYFLRDLFLVTLMTPIISILSRRYLHIFISIVFLTSLFTFFPIWSFFGYSILYRYDTILFYFIGFCLARHKVLEMADVTSFEYKQSFIWFLLVCLAVTWLLAKYKIDSFSYTKVKPLFGVLFFIVVPGLLSLIVKSKKKASIEFLLKFSPYSFTLFLVHTLVATVLLYFTGGWWLAVNNASPAYLQILSLIAYLSIAATLSFCIAQVYWITKSKIKSKMLQL